PTTSLLPLSLHDALPISLQSIFAHKLRAFLTLIGIIIGVAAVVVVGASVSGLNTYVTEKVAKLLGANHFMMARMAFQGRRTDDRSEEHTSELQSRSDLVC